jgi:hypothetical protein
VGLSPCPVDALCTSLTHTPSTRVLACTGVLMYALRVVLVRWVFAGIVRRCSYPQGLCGPGLQHRRQVQLPLGVPHTGPAPIQVHGSYATGVVAHVPAGYRECV